MPRRPRLHMPYGYYHVTLRGNHRQAIFFRDSDRATLETIVAESLQLVSARLHAYCWMTNHVHLLVQVSDEPLGKLILRIAGKYARIVQAAMKTTGHLFERRHHAVLVDSDRYLLTLVRYIHMNPVRAKLVARPGDYPWTSHHEYAGHRSNPWVTTSLALGMLSANPTLARRKYLELIGAAEDLRWGSGLLQPHPENSLVLGDDSFLARIATTGWKPRVWKDLEELLAECCRRHEVTPQDLASPSRSRYLSAARAWLSREALAGRIATITAVARRLGRTETAIRRLIARHRLVPD